MRSAARTIVEFALQAQLAPLLLALSLAVAHLRQQPPLGILRQPGGTRALEFGGALGDDPRLVLLDLLQLIEEATKVLQLHPVQRLFAAALQILALVLAFILGELATTAAVADEPEPLEPRLVCLERCLGSLSAGDREMILHYYHGDKRSKIENRKRLTDLLQVPINALRMRALRLRERLQACVERCLEA